MLTLCSNDDININANEESKNDNAYIAQWSSIHQGPNMQLSESDSKVTSVGASFQTIRSNNAIGTNCITK